MNGITFKRSSVITSDVVESLCPSLNPQSLSPSPDNMDLTLNGVHCRLRYCITVVNSPNALILYFWRG